MTSFIKDTPERETASIISSFRRYRLMVGSLKFLLPFIAGIIIFLIVFFAQDDKQATKFHVKDDIKKSFRTDGITSVGVMENPRFQGVDGDNQPYAMKAQEAWQENSNEIHMRGITADLTTSDSNWLSSVAGAGRYFLQQNIVQLYDGVDIFISKDSDNIQIQAQNMQIDLKKSIIESTAPIRVNSNMANFSATGFVAERKAQKITFTGPINLVIVP